MIVVSAGKGWLIAFNIIFNASVAVHEAKLFHNHEGEESYNIKGQDHPNRNCFPPRQAANFGFVCVRD